MDFDLDDLEELEREHAEQMAGQTLDDLEQLEREAEAQAAASEGLTRRDALRQGLLGIVAVGAGLEATREGVMQVMEDKDESYGKPTRTQEHLETVVEHEVTTPIFLNHRFDKYPTDGSGHFKSYMSLFGEVFWQKANQATYYDLDGDVLGEITLPDDWHKKGRNAKQAWHNDNRRNIAKDYYVTPTEWNKTGYPLSAVPRVVGIPDEEQHKSPPLADIEKRLKEKVADPRYFDGEEVVYMDAIRVICE